jgi:hypothetical protein
MVTSEYEIVEAEWPDNVPATKKALQDFLKSGLKSGEIKGNKEFLLNVRRAAKANAEIDAKIELRMADNRLFARLRDAD